MYWRTPKIITDFNILIYRPAPKPAARRKALPYALIGRKREANLSPPRPRQAGESGPEGRAQFPGLGLEGGREEIDQIVAGRKGPPEAAKGLPGEPLEAVAVGHAANFFFGGTIPRRAWARKLLLYLTEKNGVEIFCFEASSSRKIFSSRSRADFGKEKSSALDIHRLVERNYFL